MKKCLAVLCMLLICTALLASLFQWDTNFVQLVQDGYKKLEWVSNVAQGALSAITDLTDHFVTSDQLEKENTSREETLRWLFTEHRSETMAYLTQNYSGTGTPKHNGHYVFAVKGLSSVTQHYVMLDTDFSLMKVYSGASVLMRGVYDSNMEPISPWRFDLLAMAATAENYEVLDIYTIKEAIQNAQTQE